MIILNLLLFSFYQISLRIYRASHLNQNGFINRAVVKGISFVVSSFAGAFLRNIASLCPANTPERKYFSSFHEASSNSKLASITS